eukprot:Awhi_evm1s4227
MLPPEVLVIFLVGPKGVGKSTTGQLMKQRYPDMVHYVPSETIFMQVKENAGKSTDDIYKKDHHNQRTWVDDAYDAILVNMLEGIDNLKRSQLKSQSSNDSQENRPKFFIVCESTGTPLPFPTFVQQLQGKFKVVLFFMYAELRVCSSRINERDSSVHMECDEALIEKVHNLSMKNYFDPGSVSTSSPADSNLPKNNLSFLKVIDTTSEQITPNACVDEIISTLIEENIFY